MPQDLSQQFVEFSSFIREFALTADEADLKAVFPGHVVSPGDCFYPVHIRVMEPFKAFKIVAGNDEPVSLCFSKAMFIGIEDGVEEPKNVSQLGSCSQSSAYGHFGGEKVGLWGEAFTNNVHTEKEVNPWWQVDFPENVRVRRIYFYRRVDWSVIHEQNLRIVGVTAEGEEKILFCPEELDANRQIVAANLERGIEALQSLRAGLTGDELTKFDAEVSEALSSLQACVTGIQATASEQLGLIKRGVQALKAKLGKKHVSIQQAAIELKQRQAIADGILEAVYAAIGGAKDFGCTLEDALNIDVSNFEASQLRFRIFGEIPPGLAGAELTVAGQDEPIAVPRNKLELTYRPYGFQFPQSYQLGLTTQVRSRIVKLGEVQTIEAIKVWNLDQQHAANTLFLEVAGRASDDDEWTVLHDQGAAYRHALSVLRIVDYLLRSAWTPSYARLMGKLFAQYRRRRMMKPLAKLVRDKAELNKAVFEGAQTIPPKTKHAAPLVLGKHGLQVPVAFRPVKEVMTHLVEIRDKVRATGHLPMFMYGTLLGAIREKDFIPHDDDLDLAVIVEGVGPDDLMAECEKLISVFNEAGVPCKLGSAIAPLIHCHRGPVTIDIFVLGHVDDKIYWPHTALKIVPERADIFLPASTIEFKGETFDAPHDPAAVSEARYGADWHIPNPAFEF